MRSRLAVAWLLLACAGTSCANVRVAEPPTGGPSGARSSFVAREPVRIVIMCAVEPELEKLLAASRIDSRIEIAGRTHHVGSLEGHPVVMLLAGVSMVNAAAATQAVVDHFEVGAIVFSGIAGGANPGLNIGDVTVPSRWGQHQEMVFARQTNGGWDTGGRAQEFTNFGMMFPRGQLMPGARIDSQRRSRQFWFAVDERMLARARELAGELTLRRCADSGECLERTPHLVVGGNGVSGPTFLDNTAFREWIWDTFEADAVDMETAAVAQVAAINGTRFLAFRSLSDLAGGGAGANQIRTFGRLAADNSAAVLLQFLRDWRGVD
ncbi:MAG TPA: 5'-methylthioadenosine/S-adenosylhomocysteine nucleosidase [Acidobacteriota bacterium]|nr:5'-methylthioadenosine/S-adenosylhomocysteine nucleosidase [Acidobacteriota bacterium]